MSIEARDRSIETTDLPAPAPGLNLKPLLAANAACIMAMMAFVVLIGPIARALGLAEWQAGASVTVSGVVWFLLARAWGRLSDRVGRKRVLMIGVGGFALTYLALVLGMHWALASPPAVATSFVLLLLGRGAIGAFYAVIPTVGNALIADRTAQDKRTAAMAALGVAGAIGTVIGPALAGLLVSRGLSLPLYVSAALPFAAWLVLATRLSAGAVHKAPEHAPSNLLDRRLRLPVLVAFVAMSCVMIAQICVGFYAIDRLGLNQQDGGRIAGYALTAVGVALIVAQLGVRRLSWPPRRLIGVGASIAMLGFVAAGVSVAPWQLITAYVLMAFGLGFVFPAFSAAAANAVEPHEQGAVAGTVAAAQGAGMVLGPILGGTLYGLWPSAPYWLCALALGSVALGVWVKRR